MNHSRVMHDLVLNIFSQELTPREKTHPPDEQSDGKGCNNFPSFHIKHGPTSLKIKNLQTTNIYFLLSKQSKASTKIEENKIIQTILVVNSKRSCPICRSILDERIHKMNSVIYHMKSWGTFL